MANAAPQLQEAYELIESGDLQSARQLLDNIRSDNENNPDFWWVYAHAVEYQKDGVAAIERVRQLAPNYPGLQDLSQRLGISSPKSVQSLSPRVPAPSTEDVEEYYEDAEDEFDSEPRDRGGSSSLLPFIIIGGIAVIIVIGLLFFISSLFSGIDGTETPVAIAITDISPEPILTFDSETTTEEATFEPSLTPGEDATDVEIDTPTAEPTDAEEVSTEEAEDTDIPPTETPTEEPTDTPEPEDTDPFADVYTELEAFGVPEEGIALDTTDSFGDTYIVTTCSALGPVATQNILGIMDALSPIADTLDADVEGLAFEITDCDTNTVRLSLGFDRETADNYWSEEIDQSELQRAIARVN